MYQRSFQLPGKNMIQTPTSPADRHPLAQATRGALVISLATSALVGCRPEEERPVIVRPVQAMQVQTASAFDDRWFPGRAKATQEVNLAFEVSGQLIERPVNIGNSVKTGQVLARLDPRDYDNNLAAARAARNDAKAQYERMQIAIKTRAVSRQDLDNAKALFEASDARVRIAEKAVEDTVLRAKFDGTIAATYVENFQNVRAKQKVLRLLDTSRIEMWVNIPESLISYSKYVKDVRVRFDVLGDRDIPARIKEISNEASETTRTYPVNFIMDQPEDVRILPGMAGRANGRIVLPGTEAGKTFQVPISALGTSDNQGNFVWVIDETTGKARRRNVEVVQTTSRGAVVKGLQPAEWVATAGVHTLQEGQEVRILEAKSEG